ncbi:hybrid sensor histidine kinase/response regulator [Belliella aquatica]|uniref:histidine kinase n=1 Tax=Belliella aquatica TaxID=1323734 RepID=A0ABQ1N3U7_9BACT|nr:response regulator [Belliella aquatica]MCH7407379.1 response regulator [Belliella aquatica]GGC52957.1 hypothetical protein GCM10010993_34240 [Belliella aquatica]
MSINILLVEDEIELQENIKDILEIHDFSVVAANNGLIALHYLENYTFDIVVSDVMMPEMNGFELLSKVRNDKKLINLPFLFLTAKVEKEDFRKGMEYGAEDYLTKPVHAKDLVNAINVAINKKQNRELWLSDKIDEVLKEERNVKYHELRTPLFGLMSILELVTTSIDSFDYIQLKEILGTAYDASKRLNDSLLNLARFNELSSYEPDQTEILSFKEFLENKLVVLNKTFSFSIDFDFNIYFDDKILEFILNEILSNANKFCSQDPIYVSVEERTLIIANLQDSLLSPQEIKITPFGQINRKYNEQQGLGLGLYLSKMYAKMNNAILSARISNDLKFIIELQFK